MPGARPRHTHFEERLIYDPAVACWLDTFLDHWLTLESRVANVRSSGEDGPAAKVLLRSTG